jgi:hypothetical protein
MRDFRKLAVWEKAHQVALATYRLAAALPASEALAAHKPDATLGIFDCLKHR